MTVKKENYMTADITQAQEYRRELRDAIETIRQAGDLGQYLNDPPISQNSAKLSSVAQAMLFLAVHLYRMVARDFEPEPTAADRAEFERQVLRVAASPEVVDSLKANNALLRATVDREVDDLALTMAGNERFAAAIKKGSGL